MAGFARAAGWTYNASLAASSYTSAGQSVAFGGTCTYIEIKPDAGCSDLHVNIGAAATTSMWKVQNSDYEQIHVPEGITLIYVIAAAGTGNFNIRAM